MPSSGYALFTMDGHVRVFDGEREVGRIAGQPPMTYYGWTKGFALQRADGLFVARPGASALEKVEPRYSSGLVTPGWNESGPCATHPDQPQLSLCDRQIDVRTNDGARRTIGPPAGDDLLARGRWIDAQLSPDGQWVGANWQSGCEVVYGFVVAVADGQLVALVSGPHGPAPSGFLTWLATGEAVGTWRKNGDCGERDTFGVYRFLPGTAPRLWFDTDYSIAVW
jgi:hypothetical protein